MKQSRHVKPFFLVWDYCLPSFVFHTEITLFGLELCIHFVFIPGEYETVININSFRMISWYPIYCPAPWNIAAISVKSPAQNCMRCISTRGNESLLSGPPVHHIHIPADHNKVQVKSNLYAQNKCLRLNKQTQHCYFHFKEHSDLLEAWRSSHDLIYLSMCSGRIFKLQFTTDPHWSSPSPFFEEATLKALKLCHNLTGRTASKHMVLFSGFVLSYHSCRVLPACRWQFHPVKNNHSLK